VTSVGATASTVVVWYALADQSRDPRPSGKREQTLSKASAYERPRPESLAALPSPAASICSIRSSLPAETVENLQQECPFLLEMDTDVLRKNCARLDLGQKVVEQGNERVEIGTDVGCCGVHLA
jgi:hypothetical protein